MVYKSSQRQESTGGTVTSVGTGTGLTGGPITTTGTISVASSTINSLAGYDGTGIFSTVLVGSGLSLSAGTLTASGAVSSVSNSDGSLTISPTTGAVVASLALGHANTWTGQQTFNASAVILGTVTANTALVADGSKNVISSVTTLTELSYVSGVTSSIQTQLDGKQATGNYITALTGDGSASGPGSAAFTLATVNSNVGSFGSSTSIPSFTVNGKGLITAASGNAVVAPADTLTGTTLASNVVTSSLTSVGTLTNLTVTNPITGSITGNAGTVTVGDAGGDTTTWVLLGTSQTGSLSPATDAGLTYNATTDALTATTFSGALSGNASTATALLNARTIGGVSFDGTANIVPQTIESANEATDTTCFPLFITASGTQQLQPKNSTSLTYNSNTSNLAATTFTGALSGNATTATTLATARAIGGVNFDGSASIVPQTIESANEATDTTCFPLFITASGTQQLQPKNNVTLTFNSNTGALGATSVTATGVMASGANSGTGGQLTLNGSTSGSCAIKVAAAAGTGTIFQLPADNGTNTYVLQTDGAGVTSWVSPGSGGVPTQITVANEATDTTCFPCFFTAATGDLGPKTNANLTFNSNTGALGATTLGGTLTTAAQTNITSVGTLTGGATGAGFTVAFGSSTFTGTIPTANLPTAAKVKTIGFSTASASPSTGQQGSYAICEFSGTITAWNIGVDAGTCTVKVWKIAAGTTSPTSSNNINSNGVAISSGTFVRSTTVTDFTTTTVTAGDIFGFNLTAVSGASKIFFGLEITSS